MVKFVQITFHENTTKFRYIDFSLQKTIETLLDFYM